MVINMCVEIVGGWMSPVSSLNCKNSCFLLSYSEFNVFAVFGQNTSMFYIPGL